MGNFYFQESFSIQLRIYGLTFIVKCGIMIPHPHRNFIMRFAPHASEDLVKREATRKPVVAMVKVCQVFRFPVPGLNENKCGFICVSKKGHMIQFFVDEKDVLASQELTKIHVMCQDATKAYSGVGVWLLVAGKQVINKDNKKYSVKEARIPSAKIVAAYEHNLSSLRHTMRQGSSFSVVFNESLKNEKNGWLFRLVGEETKNNTIFF